MYGMNSKSDFNKQSEKNMERAVTNGQMSISDYYNRKTELQQASISGVDDGHSCTKGKEHNIFTCKIVEIGL